MKCTYGCQWKGTTETLQKHLSTCEFSHEVPSKSKWSMAWLCNACGTWQTSYRDLILHAVFAQSQSDANFSM